MKSVDEVWELLRQAEAMPYGPGQLALMEQVLPHADATGDRELMFATRMQATETYVYAGERAKSFVTFSWCLSDYDRNPAPFHRHHQHTLLWHFKYMAGALTDFPEVSLERTYAVLDDMERRYRDTGHTQHAVYMHRYFVADHIGDDAAADSWYEKWVTTPRDALSDCSGCDPSAQVRYLSGRDRFDEAVALAEPVLAGRLTCIEQPQGILNSLLKPYVRTGRLEEAADAHRRSYRRMRPHLADLDGIGDHIAFCTRTGNEHRGLEIVQRHIDWLDKAPSPSDGMMFAAAAGGLLRRLSTLGHGDTVVHRRDKDDLGAAELAEELAAYATGLAVRFDARNASTRQSELVAERLDPELWPQFTLSLSARRKSGPPQQEVSPTPQPEAVQLPASPAELLDLGFSLIRQDREGELGAVLAAYDDHPGGTGLDQARRLDLEASWLVAQPGRNDDATRNALLAAEQKYRAANDEAAAREVAARRGFLDLTAEGSTEALTLTEAYVAGVEQSDDQRERAQARSRRGTVLQALNRLPEALADQDAALDLAAATGDDRLVARVQLRRADVLEALERSDDAVVAGLAALEFYRRNGTAARRAVAAGRLAQMHSEPATQVELFTEALAMGDTTTRLPSRLGRARALMALDRPHEAIGDYVEAVAICTEQEIAEGAAFLRAELAQAYAADDRKIEAAEVAEEAIAAMTRFGAVEQAFELRYFVAGIYAELGENDLALATYEELAGEVGDDNAGGRAQIRENWAGLLYKLDQDAAAAERFGEAAEDMRAVGDVVGEIHMRRRRLMALHWADDVPAAEETLRLATSRFADLPADLAGHPQTVWERAMLGFEAGRLFNARDRYAEAIGCLMGNADRLRAISAVDDATQIDIQLGVALRGVDRAPESEALLNGLLQSLAPDSRLRGHTAYELARTLEALGRDKEAAELREQEGLDDD